MAIFRVKYRIWLSSYSIERLLANPNAELNDDSFTISDDGVDMSTYGYVLIQEAESVFSYTYDPSAVASAAVKGLQGKLDQLQAEHAARVGEVLDQIRRFEALPFNSSQGADR